MHLVIQHAYSVIEPKQVSLLTEEDAQDLKMLIFQIKTKLATK
jgi:hypothetical protein